MTILDKFIQRHRMAMAARYVPQGATLLDVGCHQGELFSFLAGRVAGGVGIDPLCAVEGEMGNVRLMKGNFPEGLVGGGAVSGGMTPDGADANGPEADRYFDAITILAVMEHIPMDRQLAIARRCFALLRPGGRVIITVPSPRADLVLDTLKKLRLIRGMSLEDHYGFEPGQIPIVFGEAGFTLHVHRTFQLGLNNLFVLEKPGDIEVSSLSFVLPCLNEERTLPACLSKIKAFAARTDIPVEIVVADNGSTDGSRGICVAAGVRCVDVPVRGYGSALHHGILAAKGSHVVFADADDSYDFGEAGRFVSAFRDGYEVVIGNRYQGGIMKGAMPFLHRYLGTPVISLIGRRSFGVDVGDFNCGMRGVRRSTYAALGMKSTGMEYATELIGKAAYKGCRIGEVPVKLYKDGRAGKPHLRTWADGWKHLRLILLLSPKWLLLYPALLFIVFGLALGSLILSGQVQVLNVHLDIHTLYFCSVFLILAMTFLQFYCMVNLYRKGLGLYVERGLTLWVSRHLKFERGLLAGLSLFVAGIAICALALYKWYLVSFQELDPGSIFRIIIPGGFCMIAGLQLVVFSFFVTMIKHND